MIVTGGLGSPRRGNLAAFGYGLAVPAPLGPIRATLAGTGALSGVLDGITLSGYIEAVLSGSGTLAGTRTAIAHLSASAAGSGGLSAQRTALAWLSSDLAGSGRVDGQLDGIDFNRYMLANLYGASSLTGPLDGVDFNRYMQAALSGSGVLVADRTATAWLETILSGSGDLLASEYAVGHIGASAAGLGAVAGLLAERLRRLSVPVAEDKNKWQTYWAVDVGKTVVRFASDGEWRVVRNPAQSTLDLCDRVYRGGFEHLLTTDLARELADAGFDVQLEN